MHEAPNDNSNEDKTENNTPIYFPYARINDTFVFWFAIAMTIISMSIIADSIAHYYHEGWTPHQVILTSIKDIGATIPAVAGIVALVLNTRRIYVSIARFIDRQTEKVRLQNERRKREIIEEAKVEAAQARAEGRAEGLKAAADWLRRRNEHTERGEPFDEPFPGTGSDLDN